MGSRYASFWFIEVRLVIYSLQDIKVVSMFRRILNGNSLRENLMLYVALSSLYRPQFTYPVLTAWPWDANLGTLHYESSSGPTIVFLFLTFFEF